MQTLRSGFGNNVLRRASCSLVAAMAASLFLALGAAGCENAASYTQPSLVRVIDASYIAPPVNVSVEGTPIAYNVGEGNITSYGTVPAALGALIKITAASGGSGATGGALLATSNGGMAAGHQQSIFLSDNDGAAGGYQITVLEDQQTAAPYGQADFRFLNQAPKTGAVDIYMVPSGSTLADSVPLVTALPVRGVAGYVSFTAQPVTLVITPAGVAKPQYTSNPIALTGGEVRTVLITDAQLTSNPPVEAFMGDDAGPAQ